MAFEAKNFVICSKFQLFKASCNLWLYSTLDTLEDCLAENYFQPRTNLKNQDSPEVGDIIQCIVEGSKLAYLKIVGKAEKPYNITVARTFLENEATLLSLITELQLDKASKATDFVTPITDENLGLTKTEQTELEGKIDLAANSGRMITDQGVWYAKMYTATVPPAADDGTNYADFSQVDQHGDPIIVIYERQSGAWVQTETVTPPKQYDGYVPVTSKIWDIPEQDGQQGGRVLWNHESKQFTPYPTIVSFDSIEITGDSTVQMPATPSDDNIANVGFVMDHYQTAGRNVGDVFYTSRTDAVLNGAVECDGATYQTTNYTGAQSIGNLLANNKIPYVSLATYATLISNQGWCDKFGWDGVGTTAFKVPTLTAKIVTENKIPIAGNGSTLQVSANGSYRDLYVDHSGGGDVRATPNVSVDSHISDIKNLEADITSLHYEPRIMVQLSVGIQDSAYSNLAEIAYTGDYSDLLNKPTIPAAQVNSDWDAVSGVAQILNKPSLATVATSGSYSDLSNKPTIPAAQVNSDWNANNGVAEILNKPTLAAVATSGAYSDLTGTPTIPSSIGDLSDVTISTPSSGQVLMYDGSKWENASSSSGHEVIAFQAPTALNNYTWYRKYADDWVEQGGTITDGGTETLPVTMAEPDYSVSLTAIASAPGTAKVACIGHTTTQISAASDNGWSMRWEVKGMAA